MDKRACVVSQIVDNIKTNIIGVGRNSATPIPNKSLQILLPVGGMNGMNEQLRSKDNTYKWAKQIQNKANSVYVSKQFGNVIDIDNDSNPNGTLVTIQVPTKLVDWYVKQSSNTLPSNIEAINKPLTNEIVFYPAQFTIVAYDPNVKSWVMKIEEEASIGGEKQFKKNGWIYTYAPWLDEDLEEGEQSRAYSRYRFENGKPTKSEYLTETEWKKERGSLDDNPYSVKEISFEQAKSLWEDYKKSMDFLRNNNPLASKSTSGGTINNGLKSIFSESRQLKSEEVLNRISKSEANLAPLANHLKRYARENNVTIQLDDVENYRDGAHDFDIAAYYDPKNNRIFVAGNMFMSDKAAINVVIHEILHSLTHHQVHKLDKSTSRAFHALYHYALANTKRRDQYALYTVDEFIVALFTDPLFIREMSNIAPMNGIKKYDNLFEQIMDYILKLLGITPKDSFYAQAYAIATNIIEEQAQTIQELKVSNDIAATILPYKANEPLFDVTYLRGNPNIGTEKKYSVRPENAKTGIYEIDGNLYNVTKVYNTPVFAESIPNLKEIRAKSIGDDPIRFEHIKDFYDNKKPMFIYKIDKVESNASNKKKVLNNEPKVSNLQNKNAKQEIFFKRLMKELKKRLANVEDKLKHDKFNKDFLKEYEDIKGRLDTIIAGFNEYQDTKNRSILVNLAKAELKLVENYINEVEIEFSKGNFTLSPDELVKNVNILKIFMELNGVKEEASALYERLKPDNNKRSIITRYVLNMVKEYLGKDVTEEDLEFDSKDIFVGEKWFGTLSDVNNYIAKTVGFMIKKAQNNVATQNRKSFEEVEAADKELSKWAKENGMSKQEVFDLFIQDIGKTTILTKEFTTEFLDMVKKGRAIENKSQRDAYFKSFAFYDPTIANYRPINQKHYNPNYKKIFSTPELKKYYTFFKSSIDRLREDLPINLRENFIPDVVEQSLVEIMRSDKSVADKFKDSIAFMTDIYDYDYDKNQFITDEELLADDIPMRYIGNLGSDIKSRDLSGSLLKFLYFANFHKEMTNVLPKTRLLQEEIAGRNYLNPGKPSGRVTGENSNVYNMTKDFIEMQVKGKMRKDDESIKGFNYSKYIDFGIKYTSLLRIGLNPFNAVTNILVGSIGNIVEAVGGRYFTVNEFMKANKVFFSQVFNENSKVNKLINLLNPLMELEDYANLDAIRIGSKDYHDRVKNLMYAPQRIGEKMMQVSTMIANLMHDKVTTKDGKSISLWEAFDENGVWDEAKMGYKFDEEMVFKTTNKIQRINQMIHGRYSARDAATAQQYALVRAAYQFKKWIPAAIEARFISKRFDERLGYEIEGRYRTLWNESLSNLFTNPILAFKNLLQPLIDKKGALADGTLTETEVYNMRKNAIELIIILASYLMFLGLGDDEDERTTNGWYKFTMMQLDRVTGDLLMWWNPDKAQKGIIGVPLTKTITDLTNVVKNVPYAFGVDGSIYERGYRKGENKFIAKVIDATPIAKPMADFIRGFKDVPYEELRD